MRKITLILVAVVISLTAASAFAQSTWLGVDGSAVLPTGDLKDMTKSGGGGGVHFDVALSSSIHARVDGSWLQFSSRDIATDLASKARVIPARAGLVWLVGPVDGTRFTFGAMGGAYFRQVTTTIGEMDTSDDDTFFGAGATVGMLIPMGPGGQQLEINASYDMWFDEKSLADEDLDMGIVRLGIGYRFNI